MLQTWEPPRLAQKSSRPEGPRETPVPDRGAPKTGHCLRLWVQGAKGGVPRGPKDQKNSRFRSRLKNFDREWNFRASHPPRPYFFCGEIETSRLKFSSVVKNFDRDWKFRSRSKNVLIVGPSGYGMVVDGIAKFQALEFTFQGLTFLVKSLVLLVRRRIPQKFQALKFRAWDLANPSTTVPYPTFCLPMSLFKSRSLTIGEPGSLDEHIFRSAGRGLFKES